MKMRPVFSKVICLSLLLALQSGCALGPDYQRPDLVLPDNFRTEENGVTTDSFGDLYWQSVYGDPAVQGLIKEALAAAPDILLAEARVREAEAVAGVVRADLFPQLGLSFTTSPIARPEGKQLASSFTGGAAVSWQLDLWGRLRRASEAARAELMATEDARRGVVTSLIADVAGRYYQLVAERDAYQVATRTAANQRDALQLIERLSKAGIATDAEVRQQEVALAVTEVSLPSLRTQIATSENGLSILLGRIPGAITIDMISAPEMPEAVPAGLPSRLLERRPDVRAAEQQLVAANARVGEAKARFFPNISLTGLFGRVSTEAADVLTGGAATVASLGADALQPLFAGKFYRYNYATALARLDQAVIVYRRTVLLALAEVATALTSYQEAGVLLAVQERRVASAREALRLSELRYRSGVVSFIEVLDAQRQLFAAETEQVDSLFERRLSLSQIYLALGGGWEEPAAIQ
ncbi:efflux transporter outer membrane subunit [Desulfocastanea catecholica]